MGTVKRRYELSDEEWEQAKDMLPSDKLKNKAAHQSLKKNMVLSWIISLSYYIAVIPESVI